MSLAVGSTSMLRPCPRCRTPVLPRGRRILEAAGPLCPACLTAAGLVDVDELLAASAELEDRLTAVMESGRPLAVEELLEVAGRIVAGVRSVALDALATLDP